MIPNGVTSVGNASFHGCTGLTAIAIPGSVAIIGDGAFAACTSLGAITVDAGNAAYRGVGGVLFDAGVGRLVQYPGGKAGDYTIPDGVTSIGIAAFQGCDKLTGATIPHGVTSIGDQAFENCGSLAGVALPNGIARIGDGTFSGCTQLSGITIPESVTDIGGRAFMDCTHLANITIPDGVAGIGWRVFSGCKGLGSATIGNGVAFIGFDAFVNCTGMTNLTIGNGVADIGAGAFAGCTGLTGLHSTGNAPALESANEFVGNNGLTVYYLPGATGWSATFGGRPTALWSLPYPVILGGGSIGIRPAGFGFTISWANGQEAVVEASPDLGEPVWTPVGTNVISGGTSRFSDPQWTGHPTRFYRLRLPQ